MKKKKKEEDYKPESVRLAAGLCGVVMNTPTADMLLEITKALKKYGDDFSLRHVAEIEVKIEKRYKPKRVVTAEATNPYANENRLLREGLRLSVDMFTELKNSKVKLGKKSRSLMDGYLNSAEELLAKQTVAP